LAGEAVQNSSGHEITRTPEHGPSMNEQTLDRLQRAAFGYFLEEN
jgi:hypothetical protein